ncbi:MAG: hypothetical protein FWG61_07540 [Firmicutes bacterium]|nr:hypothetical protein [Bacillota bacterium]
MINKSMFIKLVTIVILTLSLVFCFTLTVIAQSADHEVSISQGDTVAAIQAKIQTALNKANSGDTVTVLGSKS